MTEVQTYAQFDDVSSKTVVCSTFTILTAICKKYK